MRIKIGDKLNALVAIERNRLIQKELKLLKQLDEVRNELSDLRREVCDLEHDLNLAPLPTPTITVAELKTLSKIQAVRAIREKKLDLIETKKLVEQLGWYDRTTDNINSPSELVLNTLTGSSQ